MIILLGLFIIGTCIYLTIVIYCKLTCGINNSSRHLVGKVVIITGGTTGIGYETAKDMADRGAKVIIASRIVDKGTAIDKIINETGNKDVHFKELDLASFKSVRAFADDFLKNEKRLDILVNNAGMFGSGHIKTEDGLLLDMQTNHFGPFLLTSLLLPLLKSSAPSRIVNVSSVTHSLNVDLDFNNINFENHKYESLKVYGTSKLCNVLMTVELAERLKGTGVTANSLHPGIVNTNIWPRIPILKYFAFLRKLIGKTPWQGAQTTIYLAVSPEVNNVSGKYFSDCREKSASVVSQNRETAHKLWQISEKLVGIEI